MVRVGLPEKVCCSVPTSPSLADRRAPVVQCKPPNPLLLHPLDRPGAGSDPDIACGRPPAARMTGVQDAARLDEHELHFALGGGLVLDAFRDDEHFSRRDVDMPVPEVD